MDELLKQEKTVNLSKFDKKAAWNLGMITRNLAEEQKEKIVISVKFGNQHIFYFAGSESTKDNEDWVRRKRNVVERFEHSSHFVGTKFNFDEEKFYRTYAAKAVNYAIHGGAFPISVEGVGMVGSIVISGLASEDDHQLCYFALKALKDQL